MNQTMRLAAVELEQWEIDYLRRVFPNGQFSTKHLDEAGDIGQPDVLAIFIYSPITKDVLDRYPALRLIATMSTGYDHIDLAACHSHGITVCNVPSYGENTVAEHALALLLALSRKIIPSVVRTQHGDFRLDDLRGVDLAGKTMGVVGAGRIGQRLIKMGRGLEMSVIAYDPRPNQEQARRLEFQYVPLDDLLRRSDVVSLHAPATPDNQHLLNEARLRLMKPTAWLINTARGQLIDTQALLKVLGEGHLAGVGLDVLEEECTIKEERELLSKVFQTKCDLKTVLADHLLLNHPKVIITPHNAFNSGEALQRILDTTIKNIEAFEHGQPVNIVQ
ncbi:MAG: hydroxyacid dehydrogenase [Candidatus Kerfeldbacteria bacterium]|nr:hydroxyacid dehydrogenase [Candidatus Kerfeldbacteria bacterium]